VHAAPAVSCAKMREESAHEHKGTVGTLRHSLRNGFTAYAVLSPATNSSCHRRKADWRLIKPGRADFTSAHLGASNGRQDHTVLPYAAPVFAKRLRRAQVRVRRSFSEGGSAFRPARRCSLTVRYRPANTHRADAAASTASHPAFVTTRDPPL